ncbi:hypothetical protein B0H11DRAFT_166850 [Mycena galericulata]|nr:hypothetical protein B0H11DRAFT_166850 [Mycena galericulata]
MTPEITYEEHLRLFRHCTIDTALAELLRLFPDYTTDTLTQQRINAALAAPSARRFLSLIPAIHDPAIHGPFPPNFLSALLVAYIRLHPALFPSFCPPEKNDRGPETLQCSAEDDLLRNFGTLKIESDQEPTSLVDWDEFRHLLSLLHGFSSVSPPRASTTLSNQRRGTSRFPSSFSSCTTVNV